MNEPQFDELKEAVRMMGRHLKGQKAIVATENGVAVWCVQIPKERVLALTHKERYVFYLFGHVFNELNTLRKTIAFSFQQAQVGNKPFFEAEIAQSLFFVRITAMKLWEFRSAVNGKDAGQVLRDSFCDLRSDLSERLKKLKKRIGKEKWIEAVRNAGAAHYPSFKDWEQVTRGIEPWSDDFVYLGTQTGNTFFSGADTTASVAMLGTTDVQFISASMDALITSCLDLLASATDLVQDILDVFMEKRLISTDDEFKSIGFAPAAPNFTDVKLPFWTAMPKK